MRTLVIELNLLILLLAGVVYGHGEGKLGPHGGYIRMPGAYHTEVVLLNANQLKLYLLDINWQNPTIQNSKVTLNYKGKVEEKAKCDTRESYFVCDFPKNINLKKTGLLTLESERENQRGNTVSYELPLKLPPSDDGHSGHH